jgi:hypothetical protein
MDFVIGVIIIAVVIFIGAKLAKRATANHLAEAWTGTVVKKWLASYSDEDGDVTKVPTIQVQIDGGKKKKLAVSAEIYNGLSEGDKVQKTAGQKDPVKA